MNEADTCRLLITPKLQALGWDTDPHRICEQVSFTDGRIVVTGKKAKRRPGKRADYVLRYSPDMPIAVVEAKPDTSSAGEGMQQAKDYAEILGLKFAYATNGKEILEFDFQTGLETTLSDFPPPDVLWARLKSAADVPNDAEQRILTPAYRLSGKIPRYYQEIAINRVISSILQGKKRILLTMATGTGKTVVAFQICWKLWSSHWNRTGDYRRPRILFLADRNILVDDPKDKDFAPFGDARWKIEDGIANKGREMYFATYQSIAEDSNRPGLYKEYAPDFFDLIIIDECHRGSAKKDSTWREILEYFKPAFQLGMTATPLRDETRNTYEYFRKPVFTYSLRQGIEDGFLAPYRVHRVITEWDAAGWRPNKGELDRFGREIPDEEYETADFERIVSLRARTRTVAKHLSNHLRQTDRFAKTIVFCVDQEHADEMRRELSNLNRDLVSQHPDYVCRVTSDEKHIGRGHLSRFQDIESDTPVILTTSRLLTTGVDAQTVKNVVLLRVINSMSEFKQIIGRGTRVRSDYDKLFFSIIDYTGSATRLFADKDFDGDPIDEVEEPIDETEPPEEPPVEPPIEPPIESPVEPIVEPPIETTVEPPIIPPPPPPEEPRKFYFDGGVVDIAAHLVYELDPDGNQLRVMKYTVYTAEKVRTLYRNAEEMRCDWADPDHRKAILEKLADRGIDFDEIAKASEQPDADPLDLLCHLAFNTPLRTRRERANRVKTEDQSFFEQFSLPAREILFELLDSYSDHGSSQFVIPDVLEIPPINQHGTVLDIAILFGGPEKLREAVHELQIRLYAA